MKLPDSPWQSRDGLRRLLKVLGASEGDTRYVGGAVRDSLLGLVVSDVDLATRLTPREVIDRLKAAHIKAVPTGLAHGTVTAVLRDGPVEVTTLRRDVATDGRRATIAYTSDWKEDAARRDFTINALSADPETGEIFDYFGGLMDLEAGHVRFIGDPLTRIAEDHLRILRFFRFHARFGRGAPDEAALDACRARANDLMALSRERIADELLKLLALPEPAPTLALMVDNSILVPVLPEIEAEHVVSLARLVGRERAFSFAPDPVRRLAALLPPDPAVAGSVAARLRLSNKAGRRLASAAGRESEKVSSNSRLLAYRIGHEEAIDRLLLGAADESELRALDGWIRPLFPLTGGDLIAMGLPPGPVVARTLQAIEREWTECGFPEERSAAEAIARRHVDQVLRASQ